jgi:hypothetical protein
MEPNKPSILCIPSAIALLVNESAIDDFNIFIKTLMYWNTILPTLYIYTTSTFPEIVYKGKVVIDTCLDIYNNLTRKKMESMPSQQGLKNYFHDFTLEKCNLMSWAIVEHGDGVLFCDADICWMGPLPSIPEDTRLGLSPHYIRHEDEKKFGTFNAGFLYIKTVEIVEKWLLESLLSDFYEQYSLNVLAKTYTYYTFGPHINYGWWRMFQAPVSPEQRKAEWVGLTVKGKPLVCIHTHFNTKDPMTREFNTWILDRIKYNKDLSILLASE